MQIIFSTPFRAPALAFPRPEFRRKTPGRASDSVYLPDKTY